MTFYEVIFMTRVQQISFFTVFIYLAIRQSKTGYDHLYNTIWCDHSVIFYQRSTRSGIHGPGIYWPFYRW